MTISQQLHESLHVVTRAVLQKTGNLVARVESHTTEGLAQDKTDLLWITDTPDDPSCDGEYISIEPYPGDSALWQVSQSTCNKVGGAVLNESGTYPADQSITVSVALIQALSKQHPPTAP